MWLYSGVVANLLLAAGWRRMRPARPCRLVWMLSAPPLDNLLVVDWLTRAASWMPTLQWQEPVAAQGNRRKKEGVR